MLNTKWLIVNAVVAALYAGLTLALAPLSYGAIQVRLSECMTLLAFYNRNYIPGLTLGCLIANIGSPFGIVDMLAGTFATFIALYLMRYCRTLWQASLMPVIANGIIIGLELVYLSEVSWGALPGVMAYIAAGEFIAVTVVGILLIRVLFRNEIIRTYIEGNW